MSDIKFDPKNYRIHTDSNKRVIRKSLEDCGAGRSVLVDKENVLIAGNGVYEQAQELGLKVRVVESDGEELIVVKRNDLSSKDEKRKLLALADNHSSDTSMFDIDMILEDFSEDDLALWEFSVDDINIDLTDIQADKEKVGSLREKFIIPPFSILDTKQGQWQDRKKSWLALGIKSETGRDEQITYSRSVQSPRIYEVKNKLREKKKGVEPSWDEIIDFCNKNNIPLMNGTSIFDPVLCELSYRWFNVSGGRILDPFAGGSVRGVVAAKLDMPYVGIDLREEQVKANFQNLDEMRSKIGELKYNPCWKAGDSRDVDVIYKEKQCDMIFSCPPYADLEVYSDDPKDLSTMSYDEFLVVYNEIIKKSCAFLKDDRFAVFVVGEVRGKNGVYYNFVNDTIQAFQNAGLQYYNEMILVNMIGSLAMRAGKQFNVSRKIGKQHQNVLVFYKGDVTKIRNNFPKLDLSSLEVFE